MASGILGQAALAPTTNTTVYTVPSSTLAIVNINVVNRSSAEFSSVRVALASTATPQDSEYIEFGASIPSNGVLERSGIAINSGKRIIIYASTGECSVSVYGLEQSVA